MSDRHNGDMRCDCGGRFRWNAVVLRGTSCDIRYRCDSCGQAVTQRYDGTSYTPTVDKR